MTCIVGVRIPGEGAVLGADSLGGNSASWDDIASPKLYQPRLWLALGFTTSWRYGQVLGHELTIALPPDQICHRMLDEQGVLHWAVRTLVPTMRTVLKDAGYATRENEHESAGTAVVAIRDHVLRVQDDYAIIEPRSGVAACGSGMDAARVAARAARDIDPLFPPSDLVSFALRHAELESPWVRSPFAFVKTSMR